MPMARNICAAQSRQPVLRWRISKPRRRATRTMLRCPDWSWSRARLESRRYGSALSPNLRSCRDRANASTMLVSREKQAMKKNLSRREFGAVALATVAASAVSAPYVRAAEKKYDPGASDTEIKLGQTVPHSGPGSLYGVLGRVGEAYFQMLNENGGINGRQIKI